MNVSEYTSGILQVHSETFRKVQDRFKKVFFCFKWALIRIFIKYFKIFRGFLIIALEHVISNTASQGSFNSLHAFGLVLYSLKRLENLRFSAVFKGLKKMTSGIKWIKKVPVLGAYWSFRGD